MINQVDFKVENLYDINMINESVYMKKVYYGWVGKFLGGNVGAPYEGIKNIESRISLSLSDVRSFANDDADYQIAWFEVLKAKGENITGLDLALYAEKNIWYPFGEYGYSVKNIRMGIYPPVSGTFNNQYWGNGMGSPIRSEIWACIYPGQPHKAAAMAIMDSEIDHADESKWGEAFLSAMQSACFSTSLGESVKIALSCIPAESRMASMICDVIKWNEEKIDDAQMRRKILSHYGHPDFTNSLQNIGFTLAALLSYDGNILSTMETLLNFGYDTDCTCATAGAALGILYDVKAIGDDLLSNLSDEFVLGIDIKLENHSIKAFADDICSYSISKGHLSSEDFAQPVKAGYKSGAIAQYIDAPVITPGKQTTIRLIESGWNLIGRYAPELKIKMDGRLCSVSVPEDISECKDHYKITFEKDGEQKQIGFTTSKLWHFKGPYYKSGDKQKDQLYSPDGDPTLGLPGILEMFTNTASVDCEYVDEKSLVSSITNGNAKCDDSFFDNGEDILSFNGQMGLDGPFCAYLWSYFKIDEPKQIWVIAGNNSPFALWIDGNEVIRDKRHKFWMPCNNEALINLSEGIHSILIKAIRTDSDFKFSLAFKPFEEKHYHRSHFLIGMDRVYNLI